VDFCVVPAPGELRAPFPDPCDGGPAMARAPWRPEAFKRIPRRDWGGDFWPTRNDLETQYYPAQRRSPA